jgi:hypothetical protein
LGEAGRVGLGDEAEGLIPQGEFGVAEQGLVGARDEAAGHLQDGPGGSAPDAGREFLGLLFQVGAEGLGHGGAPAGRKGCSSFKTTPK